MTYEEQFSYDLTSFDDIWSILNNQKLSSNGFTKSLYLLIIFFSFIYFIRENINNYLILGWKNYSSSFCRSEWQVYNFKFFYITLFYFIFDK